MDPITIRKRTPDSDGVHLILTERMLRHRIDDLDAHLLDAGGAAPEKLADLVLAEFCPEQGWWASTWDNNSGGCYVKGTGVWAEAVAQLLA